MASDDLMAMEQPWMFRPTFPDNWITDIFTNENDTLTNAIQKSISYEGDAFSADILEPLLAKPMFAAPLHTPSASAPVSKQRPSGRVAKRKSRVSQRAKTTFIAADPSNFRQMVQQVTGVGFNSQMLKPEPQRASTLPTLDTSALFMTASLEAPANIAVAVGGDGRASNLETFCSFPTLESWKVM